MLITKVHIEKFRGFHDQEFETLSSIIYHGKEFIDKIVVDVKDNLDLK